MKLLIFVLLVFSVLLFKCEAQEAHDDLETVAAQILVGGDPDAYWELGPDGRRSHLGDPYFTPLSDVRAITNRTDVLAKYESLRLATLLSPAVLVPRLDASGSLVGLSRMLATPDNTTLLVTHTASPERSIAEQIAEYRVLQQTQAVSRAEIRAEIAATRTNLADARAIRDAQTNGIAQAQALVFTAFTTSGSNQRAQITALRNALVDDMRRQNDVIRELIDAQQVVLDELRRTRQELRDATPEEQ